MATKTLRPNAAGDRTEANPVGAANNWDCVDEASANDGTDYIGTGIGTTPDEDLYNLPASGLAADAIIDKVKVHFRSWETGPGAAGGTVAACIKENGVDTAGTAQTVIHGTWANYSQTWTTRPSGGAWTTTDIDALQIGVRQTSLAASTQTTQVYVVVTYRGAGWVSIGMPNPI